MRSPQLELPTRTHQETARCFVEVQLEGPLAPLRVYRTGDLASWTVSKGLELRGRKDHQVGMYGMRHGEVHKVKRGGGIWSFDVKHLKHWKWISDFKNLFFWKKHLTKDLTILHHDKNTYFITSLHIHGKHFPIFIAIIGVPTLQKRPEKNHCRWRFPVCGWNPLRLIVGGVGCQLSEVFWLRSDEISLDSLWGCFFLVCFCFGKVFLRIRSISRVFFCHFFLRKLVCEWGCCCARFRSMFWDAFPENLTNISWGNFLKGSSPFSCLKVIPVPTHTKP